MRGDTLGSLLAGLLARPALHPATGPLCDEEGEHRAERVRRPGDREPGALHHPHEPWPRVSAVVPGADVVVGPGPLVGGHGQQHPAPGCEHPTPAPRRPGRRPRSARPRRRPRPRRTTRRRTAVPRPSRTRPRPARGRPGTGRASRWDAPRASSRHWGRRRCPRPASSSACPGRDRRRRAGDRCGRGTTSSPVGSGTRTPAGQGRAGDVTLLDPQGCQRGGAERLHHAVQVRPAQVVVERQPQEAAADVVGDGAVGGPHRERPTGV